MKSRFAILRLPASATSRIGLISFLSLVLPPLFVSPWLPFLDLVAFVGLDSFPANQSYGPLHYAVFQFTYIIHYMLSRAMSAFSISPSTQVLLLYLLQGSVFFLVIWRTLERLVPNGLLRGVAIALGTLAFWDGFFIWGGPLPFSLASTALAAATFYTLREAEAPDQCNGLLVPLLSFIAVACHPFSLLFALVLVAIRWLFITPRRLQSLVLMAGLAIFGWIIIRDSPESAASHGLPSLFTWPGPEVPQRLLELFLEANSAAQQLFGFCPRGLQIYFLLMGAIHLLGFLASPFVVVLARDPDARAVRMLAALTTVVAVLYLCSRQNEDVIPGWPWRILTFYSPVTFLAGTVGPLFLLRRWQPALVCWSTSPPRVLWVLPVVIAGLMFSIQIPLLRLGANIQHSLERTRTSLLQSGIGSAFVVATNMDEIQPFYLRCVPFLLFSDPALVRLNLLFYTEWHIQDRHPTRLAETWWELGRTKYQAFFSVAQNTVDVRVEPVPAQQIALPVGNNQAAFGGKPNLAAMQFRQANLLMQLGCVRDAILHYEAALRIAPAFAEAHNNLGVAFLSSQRLPEAIKQFREAQRIRPDYADAHANLGIGLLHGGQVAEAKEHFQIALRLNPNQAVAKEGLQHAADR